MELNKKRKGVGGIVIAIIAVIALAIIVLIPSYNGLVKQKEQLDESYAQVQNVVQRRADLIPNLVSTVKGYSKHEKDTLTEVTNARSGIQNAKGPKELAEANEQMSQAIRQKLNHFLQVFLQKWWDLIRQNILKPMRQPKMPQK